MVDMTIKQCSWFGAYYDINKSDSIEALGSEDFDTKNVDDWISETEVSNEDDQPRYPELARNPTFYPTSAVKFCENCATSENDLPVRSTGVTDDESISAISYRGQAVAFCDVCQLAMCRKCCKCHGTMKMFKEHRVVPLVSHNENFIKKSIKTKHKRHQLKKHVKMYKSSGKYNHTKISKFPYENDKGEKHGAMDTLELEACAVECQESVGIHKEIDEKISGLTRRIDFLQTKLESYDQMVESFCQTVLSTQVSIVETGENIRKYVELQVDEMLEKLKTGATKFCSTLEDRKEEIVGAIDELVNSRNSLMQHKNRRKFELAERDKIAFLLKNVISIQSRVMSKNREVGEQMDVSFKPLDLTTCCPNIGRLEMFYCASGSEAPYSKAANLALVIPFENEVRGITLIRNELAVVTANCPIVYVLDANSLELNSTFNVKDMKNPYDLVADKFDVLYITEWSDKLIHKVEIPVKQATKLSTKYSYTTMSLTPSGYVLATCPLKNKALKLDENKSKHITFQITREKDGSLGMANRNGSSGAAISDETDGNVHNGAPNASNACHVIAITNASVNDSDHRQQYLFCTSDSQLALANGKGVFISRYSKASQKGEVKYDKQSISLSLHKPSHLSVDKEGFIYVCDSGNDRIILLDKFLKFVKEILKPGTSGLRSPIRIFLDQDRSRLYVAATSLYVFDLF